MDRNDLEIMRALLANSRASYQTVGRQLGLGSGTIKARVIRMMKEGMIIRFLANVKLEAFGYDLIYLVTKPVDDLNKVLRKIRPVGETFMVISGVGGVATVGIAVRGELENKVEILTKLLEPYVASIFPVRATPVDRFTRTDLLLIRHLMKYPKATVKDTARAIRTSTRTVKRRLDALTKNGALHFMILFDPAAMKGYIHFSMILNVDPKKYRDVARRIYQELGSNFLIPPPPGFQESTIVVILYADNVYEMDTMFKKVRRLEGVQNVELFIPSKIEFMQEWFAAVLENLLKRARETNVIRLEDYARAIVK